MTTQGHVLIVADFAATLVVEAAVHYLDLIVALPGYNPLQTKPIEPGWAEIRESQWRTVRRVANTGLATTIDVGIPRFVQWYREFYGV